ncbi:hypothetical protein GCM10007860_02170 [Chitiniphilus shinanonensis]|uniref:Secreted protein n=1 Tax=Chitiniphilus shinanonensis TaxID=553088 RepID=A0ABQ6BN41_9NEIS|nr:hypothetical protein GCM10007860_02170 [Chitiniphilus shinanonensis]
MASLAVLAVASGDAGSAVAPVAGQRARSPYSPALAGLDGICAAKAADCTTFCNSAAGVVLFRARWPDSSVDGPATEESAEPVPI